MFVYIKFPQAQVLRKKNKFMKLNSIRAMLIASLMIILLYVLGLFLPIIKNTKESKIIDSYKSEYII